MRPTEWHLDTERWPGPDRRRWNISRDLVEPSPDGRFACVLYSCFEIRLSCDVGLLTLLGGPPESPRVLFQPRDFTCLDFSPSPSAQWLAGSRFVAVTRYGYNSRRNRVDRVALTFLDTEDRTAALFDISLEVAARRLIEVGDEWIIPARQGVGGSDEVRISPPELTWGAVGLATVMMDRWSAALPCAVTREVSRDGGRLPEVWIAQGPERQVCVLLECRAVGARATACIRDHAPWRSPSQATRRPCTTAIE